MHEVLRLYRERLPGEFRLVYRLIFAVLGLAVVYYFINLFTNNYHGTTYFYTVCFYLMPVMLLLNIFAVIFHIHKPHLSFITWTYSTYFFLVFSAAVLSSAFQFTPFPIIDETLIRWDIALHFDTPKIMAFTYTHPVFQEILRYAYNTINPQLVLIPILLSFYPTQRRQVCVFLACCALTFLIGGSIYYFFPTVAPAHFFSSPYFLEEQYNTFYKYYAIRHNLPINYNAGGMIAFPSFHVIWAVMLVYITRKIKYLFYPVLALNICLVLATVCLGWHYLIDVIAGILLATVLLYFTEKLLTKAQGEPHEPTRELC